jgi:hypothetical protein
MGRSRQPFRLSACFICETSKRISIKYGVGVSALGESFWKNLILARVGTVYKKESSLTSSIY